MTSVDRAKDPPERCGILRLVRAVVCHQPGAIEHLRIEEVPDPSPGPDEVEVEVEFAGLSYLDVLIVGGTYQLQFKTPFIPGGEFAGRVVRVGRAVEQYRVGDLVVGETVIGALADRVVAHPNQLVPLPRDMNRALAATVLQSYTTALYALTHRISLQSGDTVLVLGAGGGVGSACVDVARSLGASVVAVASSAAKRAAALSLGALAAIDPEREDLKLRARQLSAPRLDVVVDPVGGALAEPALRALGYGGRYLVVGFASGSIPSFPLNLVLLNNRQVVGVELGAETKNNPGLARDLAYEVIAGVIEGRFRPLEPRVENFERALEALQTIRDRDVIGKVALDLRRFPGQERLI